MTQILINEGTLFHNILLDEVNQNMSRIREIHAHAKHLASLFSNFNSQLNITCRQMFRRLKVDEQQDSNIIFLSKFTIDLLGQFSKKLNLVVKKIGNQVIEPMEQFCESQQQSYKQLIQKSGDMLASIEGNSSFLNQLTKNFNSNQNLDLSESEKKEFKQIYQSQMEKCHEQWSTIKIGYQNILKEADSTNSFRCNFSLKMQARTFKLINKLVNSRNSDEDLVPYEELMEQNENLSLAIKQKIRDKLGGSILLQEKAMEEFDGKNDFVYKQRRIIDDFIGMFTSFSNVKDEESKHEKARSLILNNCHWASYFLNRLRANLHTEVKLPSVKYHQMTTIVKFLFALFAEEQNNESTLYNMLYISYRMNYNGAYVIKELGKHDAYWEDFKLWHRLIDFVKVIRDQASKKKKGNQNLRKAMKEGFQWISAHKITTQKKIRSQKIIGDSKMYDIVCEMNYYMSRLELKEKFIFDFIIEVSKKYGFSNDNIKKLLNFHCLSKQNSMNKLGTNQSKRKKYLQQKYRHINKEMMVCICVGKSLKYLQCSRDLLNLRLVSTMWAKQLKNKICKRYLIQQKNQYYIWKNRLVIYGGFSPSILDRKVFSRMLEEIPFFTQHSEIIGLDARRSLCWDQSLRQTLIQILKCFAFYHPNVGYLQGMNYLCQNILKLSDDKYTVYNIFEYLMNNPFYGMYSANFDGLRLRIYQFMRIVEREKPKLYNHFQTEKLEGEHFLLPWAITLWGQMSGELCWVLWDGFICQGWKWWVKTGLWLLNILEPELLGMNFQEMMKCFSELNTGLLNMDIKELKDFGIEISRAKNEIDRIPLHQNVLLQIQKEYRIQVNMVNEYLKKLKNETGKKKNL